jgi:hypothetical protein
MYYSAQKAQNQPRCGDKPINSGFWMNFAVVWVCEKV